MIRMCWVTAIVMGLAPVCFAADEPTFDQLKKLYQDAQKQLEISQARKNELAAENEKLKGQLAELQKQMTEMRAANDRLTREQSEWMDKTFFYRAHYAWWRQFAKQHPQVLARWEVMLEGVGIDSARMGAEFIDRDWPTTRPATQPVTQPATLPSSRPATLPSTNPTTRLAQ